MTGPDRHVNAILIEVESLSADEHIAYLRDVIVPLIENLGYGLARMPKKSVAPSVFVMASDLDKRFRWLESTTRIALSS
ncbi:hypothetical protein [Antarctobacter jejuensis]|uniref:hypothetical protein n=1 Tax=Antarctobacter jejuensis TaxID=1439938 RepID=UPI003FD599AE